MASVQKRKQPYLPIIAGLALVLVTVWLVRIEGKRFRQAVRDSAKGVMREGITEGVDQAGEVAENVTVRAGEEARGVVQEVVKSTGQLIDKAAEVPGKIMDDVQRSSDPPRMPVDTNPDEPHQLDPTATEPSSSEPRASEPRDPAAASTAATADPSTATAAQTRQGPLSTDSEPSLPLPSAGKMIGDIFQLGHTVTKTVDAVAQKVFALDAAQERTIGRQVHKQVFQEHKRATTANVQARLKRLATPILEQCQRQELSYTFEVLDDKKVNAFAHLGGYVYVTTGLLRFVADDLELQFILAHEIAHVDLRHCVSQLTYAAQVSRVAGGAAASLVDLAYKLIALGYSEDVEFEADRWAYRHLRNMGNTHDQVIAPLTHLAALERQSSLRERPTQNNSAASTVRREIENHFDSHPKTAERIRRLEQVKNTAVQ